MLVSCLSFVVFRLYSLLALVSFLDASQYFDTTAIHSKGSVRVECPARDRMGK